MGKSSSPPSSSFAADQEDAELISKAADAFFDEFETTAKERGVDRALEQHDIIGLWERGVLKGDNQDFFILTLYNQSEDGGMYSFKKYLLINIVHYYL